MKEEIILKSSILMNEIKRIKKVFIISKKDLKDFDLKVFGIWELSSMGYSYLDISKMFNIRKGFIYDVLSCIKSQVEEKVLKNKEVLKNE